MENDSIYNGVVDNAIGVAGVLEIARVLVQPDHVPKRSIILLFVTGEEKGLLGSTYYLDHPVVPLYKTIANINVDGLAIFDKFNNVVGIGSELSSLILYLKKIAAEMGLEVSDVPKPFLQSEVLSKSDQISFAQAGIPSILLMEGMKYQNISSETGVNWFINWGEQKYHTPFDDLNQFINFEASKQHCEILLSLVKEVANHRTSPTWKPGSPYINARLRSIAERR
jgi:Zn-dependent M28 family amino/carboxypeptidase